MTNADSLANDMARLDARPYSEVGVPMFVIAQDMTKTKTRRAERTNQGVLAERLVALATTLIATTPQPNLGDVARLVEVLADRHLLELDGPRFTQIADGAD